MMIERGKSEFIKLIKNDGSDFLWYGNITINVIDSY